MTLYGRKIEGLVEGLVDHNIKARVKFNMGAI